MPSQLNRAGVSNANRLISSGKVNKSSAWTISSADENRILGDPPDWSEYSRWHLGLHPDVNEETKAAYSYPFGKGGSVYRSALIAIRQRAGQQGDDDIFAAAGRLINKVDKEDKMKLMSTSITFSVPYQPSPGSDIPSKFGGIAYTGGIIPAYRGLGDCIIDLGTFTDSAPVFALVNHDPDQRAGYATINRVGNELHVIDGQFGTTSLGQQIAQEFSDGAPWQLSIGMVAVCDSSPEKRKVKLNGRDVEVNTIFSSPRVTEVSFVPAGADPHTTVYAFTELPQDSSLVEEDISPSAWEEINIERDKLQTELKVALQKITQLEAQLTELDNAVRWFRRAELLAVSDTLGLTLDDAAILQYCLMSPEQYQVAVDALRQLTNRQSALPSYLSTPQSAPESPASGLDPVSIYKSINSTHRSPL